jgi:glycosyltransferase involved in cell wall biosynthesis
MKYSIIIATLNEEKGIAKVINEIPKDIRSQAEIIVADVSTDSTPRIAEKLGAKVIRMKEKGKGRQMREAVKQSCGEILIFIDGDAEYPPEYMPELLHKLQDADLVLACRSSDNFESDDKMTKTFHWFPALVIVPIFGLINFKVAEAITGFRAMRRKDWDKLDLKSDYFEIETEMNIKAVKNNFRIGEIHIPHSKRADGLANSKFLASSNMWFKILGMVLNFYLFKKI